MTPARRAWLLVAGLPPLAAAATALLAPEPAGHWSEHLAGAVLKGAQLLVVLALAVVLRRRVPLVLLGVALLVVTGMALQSLGDWRVAQAIWRRPGDPGFGAGYEAGHDLSALGDLVVLAGGLAFAALAAVIGRLRPGAALGVAALAIVPPPFLWPAVGVAVVLLHELVTSPRERRRTDGGQGVGAVVLPS